MNEKLLSLDMICALLPKRPRDSYKNNFGNLLILAGNEEMGGAGIMASKAAVYVGSGLTTLVSHPVNRPALHARLPEAMFLNWQDSQRLKEAQIKASTVLIGPGMGLRGESKERLSSILHRAKENQVIILDGDALTIWAEELWENEKPPFTNAQLILTPHAGEWQRISKASGIPKAQELAQIIGCIIVEKGSQTVIHVPETNSYLNLAGNPGMAIGGMGDVLAGMISGLIGQVEQPLDGVLIGSFLHTYIANQIAQNNYIVLPSRLIAAIPTTMHHIFKQF